MEWLDGEDLAVRQARAPLRLRQIVHLALAVSDALGAAHEAGVVHRDIKPDNIFLCRPPAHSPESPLDFFPTLVDFGVAVSENIRVTRTGDWWGPRLHAPVQAGRRAHRRAVRRLLARGHDIRWWRAAAHWGRRHRDPWRAW
jgi:serine/threonine-protein kinase